MVFERSYPLPIPLLGVPLRGKHNPVLVALTRGELVEVRVELSEASEARLALRGTPRLGWRGELALRSFLDELVSRLEQPIEAQVEYNARGFHVAGVYAVLTYALVEAVAEEGGYEMEPVEVERAANSIDWDAGVELDYIDACRAALARQSSLVYRRGEEPIPVSLEGGALELVGEVELGEVIEDELEEEIVNALTRLVGMSVAVWSRRVVGEGWRGLESVWKRASRLENALYHALFGVELPEEGCKWTPGLQTVYGVCVEKGLGEKVELR